MKGLYDIHCHILPGVDDGARNMEESLWMLNKAYQEGVRHVILTPDVYKRQVHTTAYAEVGREVGLKFGPEDIHVMCRMGGY